MSNLTQRLIRILAVAALAGVVVLSAQRAKADLLSSEASQFAVLGQGTNDQTNFNNGTITGDIGIGTPRQFTASNASVVGNIRFSGDANTGGLSPDPDSTLNATSNYSQVNGPFTVSGGGTVSGYVSAHDSVVANAINYTNDLSRQLGTNAGTNVAITSGGSINASAGTLGTTVSVDGNALGTYRVFTVTSANFANGTFTINGSATDQVVLNFASSANLHGQILLAGGITSDHVILNFFGGSDVTHMGGPTLDVNTNGLATFGTFLDPNGSMSAVHTDIHGRFFGGDSVNQQIVSGANITAPQGQVPETGATILLMGLGLAFLAGAKRKFCS